MYFLLKQLHCFKLLIHITFLVSLLIMEISALTNHPSTDDNPEVREKYAQFYCYKLKTCTPGGEKVCGFDDTQTYLAEFEDLCTLYKVNCDKRGLFRLIEASICEGQKKYLSQPRDDVLNLTSVDLNFKNNKQK